MPSPQDRYGNRNRNSNPQQKASVSSKALLSLWDSDDQDDAAVKSVTRTPAPIHRPASSNVQHDSSATRTPAPIRRPASSNFQHESSARTELLKKPFRETFLTSVSRDEPDRVEAPATPRETEMMALMVPVEPLAAAVQQKQTESPAHGLIWWLLTRPNVLIDILRSAGGWLLLNPIKAVKLVFSWAMLLAIVWILFMIRNTVKSALEPLFEALSWFKDILAWGSTLAMSVTKTTAIASHGIVGGQHQVHQRSSYAPLQEPGLVLPRIDTSFQVTIGHVTGLLVAAMSPQAMVGFTSQLTPMTESWARAMRDWGSLRPEWMQSVGGFLGQLTQHADTLAVLDQQWAEEDEERVAEAVRRKASSWPEKLYRSLAGWLGRGHDTPVWTERQKNDLTVLHARGARDAVVKHERNSRRYVQSFSKLQEQLSSTVEPACVTTWLRRFPSQSVGTIKAAVSESEMAEENISDADVSLRALCTVVKEARAELGKLKGQLEKDQLLLLRQAEVLSEQVNALARTSSMSETETRVLRGKMIDTVKKVAEVLTEHFENEYYG
ncbi:hypothetical protein CcaCcLH18_12290 [Colletotrichum camelliae]|nr:hypothetical protein CcaCcLH18_12290 [Colletotrichum camelliae]